MPARTATKGLSAWTTTRTTTTVPATPRSTAAPPGPAGRWHRLRHLLRRTRTTPPTRSTSRWRRRGPACGRCGSPCSCSVSPPRCRPWSWPGPGRWRCSATPCTTSPTRSPPCRWASRSCSAGGRRPGATPTASAAPRTSPASSSCWSSPPPPSLAGYEAVDRLLEPGDSRPTCRTSPPPAVIGFAGNELVARYRISVGRRIGSAALVADGLHARTDGFTSLAVLLGAGGAALGWRWADPVVGLLITVAILLVLKDAAREVYRRLMDAVDPRPGRPAEPTPAGRPRRPRRRRGADALDRPPPARRGRHRRRRRPEPDRRRTRSPPTPNTSSPTPSRG